MLSLSSAPSLTSTPGLAGAGGPMVRVPRRCNVSCVRRFHPRAVEYFDRCHALGSSGITSSANIEERYNFDRFVRRISDGLDWSLFSAWTLRAGQSSGAATAPNFGGWGAFTASLVAGASFSTSGLVVASTGDRADTTQTQFTLPMSAGVVVSAGRSSFGANINQALNQTGFQIGTFSSTQRNALIARNGLYLAGTGGSEGAVVSPTHLAMVADLGGLSRYENGAALSVTGYTNAPAGGHGPISLQGGLAYIGYRGATYIGTTALVWFYAAELTSLQVRSLDQHYKAHLGQGIF